MFVVWYFFYGRTSCGVWGVWAHQLGLTFEMKHKMSDSIRDDEPKAIFIRRRPHLKASALTLSNTNRQPQCKTWFWIFPLIDSHTHGASAPSNIKINSIEMRCIPFEEILNKQKSHSAHSFGAQTTFNSFLWTHYRTSFHSIVVEILARGIYWFLSVRAFPFASNSNVCN